MAILAKDPSRLCGTRTTWSMEFVQESKYANLQNASQTLRPLFSASESVENIDNMANLRFRVNNRNWQAKYSLMNLIC